MAERRMFAKTIIDSDMFLEMPISAQVLYFHLGMRADDDGFVNNPKKIQRIANCSDDDLRILCAKQYVIPFESGVCAIKHWRIHNYIRSDRYKETAYRDEKATLTINENGSYTERLPSGIPSVNQVTYQLEPQVRLGKVSIGQSIYQDGLTDETALGMTQEEALRLRDDQEAIFQEAKRCGLPVTQQAMDQAMALYAEHGLDKLLEAIRKTGGQAKDKWHWRYVKGILALKPKEDDGIW